MHARGRVVVPYDGKHGVQAIGHAAPDLPPVAGRHATVKRDDEYVRNGTLSLSAGIGLLTWRVIGTVEDRRRSRKFVN